MENGIWESCWADSPRSARACDSASDLVYIFADENTASTFQNNEQTEDQEPVAMGPDSEPDSEQLQPDADTEPPVSEAPQIPATIESVVCGAPSEYFKAALLQATNESPSQARSCGVNSYSAAPALIWNDALARAAKNHSDDMSSNNFFSHAGSDGLQVWDRAIAQNYEYRYIGENIAAGQSSVGEVQNGWINSPGHCANIMNEQIVEMGAACVEDSNSDYRTYWTVVVGQPQ